jgi:hypothetical protein
MGQDLDTSQNLDFAEAFMHVLDHEGWSIIRHRGELRVCCQQGAVVRYSIYAALIIIFCPTARCILTGIRNLCG